LETEEILADFVLKRDGKEKGLKGEIVGSTFDY